MPIDNLKSMRDPNDPRTSYLNMIPDIDEELERDDDPNAIDQSYFADGVAQAQPVSPGASGDTSLLTSEDVDGPGRGGD